MAAYDLKDPYSVDKYRQLAYLSKQLRYYEKMFEQFKDTNDELHAIQVRQHLDDWLSDNLVKKVKNN